MLDQKKHAGVRREKLPAAFSISCTATVIKNRLEIWFKASQGHYSISVAWNQNVNLHVLFTIC